MSEVQPYCQFVDPMAFTAHVLNISLHLLLKGLWRNGSASDSRSEGWEFESLWPHLFPFCSLESFWPHLFPFCSLYVHTH